MRLSEHNITRRNYVATVFFSALLPVVLLVFLTGGSQGPTVWIPLLIMSLTLPCALAWFAWPENGRSAAVMALCGAVIVFFSLLGGGFFAGILFAVHDSAGWNTGSAIEAPFQMALAGLFLGSFVTLGLPWILGIGLSLLFRDAPHD